MRLHARRDGKLFIRFAWSVDRRDLYVPSPAGRGRGEGSQAAESYPIRCQRQPRPTRATWSGANNEIIFDGTYNYQYDAERIASLAGSDTHSGAAETQPTSGDTAGHALRLGRGGQLTGMSYEAAFGTVTASATYLYDAEGRWVGEDVDSGGVDHNAPSFTMAIR